jgi:hypothetical protein
VTRHDAHLRIPVHAFEERLAEEQRVEWPGIVDVELMKSVFSVAALSAVSLGEN